VATNIVGQNTPAIAATEAQYAQMWAQDATAMYGYAGTSAAATTLTSFAPPSQNTNPGGVANQAAAVNQATGTGGQAQLLATVPHTLQQLASAVTPSSDPLLDFVQTPLGQATSTFANLINTPLGFLLGPTAALSIPGLLLAPVTAHGASAAAVAAVSEGSPAAASLADSYRSGVGGAGVGSAGVSAGLGRAASVGALSVPQSWATGSPAVRLAATALPADGVGAWAGSAAPGGMFTGAPGGMFNGMSPVGGVVNAPRNGESRSRADSGLKVIAQMPGESGVGQNTPGRWGWPEQRAPHDASALSERDRDELVTLRKELAELALERDAAARLIKEAIRR
jgi:PPE-repeat protein